MWTITGTPIQIQSLGALEPAEVLDELDEPLLYTSSVENGGLVLVYLCAQSATHRRHLVVPTTARDVDRLKDGHQTLREALQNSWTWIVESPHGAGERHAWRLDFSSIPQVNLPKHGTMLYAHLQPMLTLRLLGPSLGVGTTPLSVVKQAATSAERTLRTLADTMLGAENDNPDVRRMFTNPPTQHMAFASFELSFGMPQAEGIADTRVRQAFDRVSEGLDKGLRWTRDETLDVEFLGADAAAQTTMLRALESITPPQRGPVIETEIRGRLLDGRAFRLTRSTRQRVQREIRRLQPDPRTRVTHRGRIGQVDEDQLFFKLRDVDGMAGTEIKVLFDDDRFDEVAQLFALQAPIVIVARELTATTLALIDFPPPPTTG